MRARPAAARARTPPYGWFARGAEGAAQEPFGRSRGPLPAKGMGETPDGRRGVKIVAPRRSQVSIPPEQPLEVVELLPAPAWVAELAAKLLHDAAGALRGGFVRPGNAHPAIGEVAGAGRAAERVVVALAVLGSAARVAWAARLVAGLLRSVAFLTHHLLHLLGHALHAALQALDGASLRVDRLAVLALAKRALGLAHGLLGVRQALLALHAHPLHPPLQLLEPLAQGLLPLAEALAGLLALPGLLSFLAFPLLALLTLLPGLATTVLALLPLLALLLVAL